MARRAPIGVASDSPSFRDRLDAGACLAECLAAYAGTGALVLAIPRGGVPVGAEVARRLGADLDVVVARKLGSPISPELAIGAVTANGGRFLNDEIIRSLDVSPAYLAAVTAREMAEARRREECFRGPHARSEVAGRIVIVVDDGLAPGATMRAAARSVRSRHPHRLVGAVPVGSREACTALEEEVDEVVCPYRPEPFFAVGVYYERFGPTEDAEVQRILQDAFAARGQRRAQAN